MKVRVASIFVVIAVLFIPSIGQEQRKEISSDRKPIDWFYIDANNRSKTLLLKLLQFTAPYPGFYQHTALNTNGHAFSTRIVPNWAEQGSSSAELNDALLAQIKQLLTGSSRKFLLKNGQNRVDLRRIRSVVIQAHKVMTVMKDEDRMPVSS